MSEENFIVFAAIDLGLAVDRVAVLAQSWFALIQANETLTVFGFAVPLFALAARSSHDAHLRIAVAVSFAITPLPALAGAFRAHLLLL